MGLEDEIIGVPACDTIVLCTSTIVGDGDIVAVEIEVQSCDTFYVWSNTRVVGGYKNV